MLNSLLSVFTPLAIQVGLACLITHCVLIAFFTSHGFFFFLPKDGPWSKTPSFTAHQTVCVPLLLYLTYEGIKDWYFELDSSSVGPVDRILGEVGREDFPMIVLGMMAFWDIPTTLLTRKLCDPIMIGHHIAMFLVTALAMGAFSNGQPIMRYYGSFYFGLIELSSVPLIFVDLFHPKHKHWNELLSSETIPSWVRTFNEMNRTVFAVLFIIVRAILFPYVSLTGVLPDVLYIANLPEEERKNIVSSSMTPVYAMATFNIMFSFLQLYWGTLVMRQIIKAIMPKSSKATEKKKS